MANQLCQSFSYIIYIRVQFSFMFSFQCSLFFTICRVSGGLLLSFLLPCSSMFPQITEDADAWLSLLFLSFSIYRHFYHFFFFSVLFNPSFTLFYQQLQLYINLKVAIWCFINFYRCLFKYSQKYHKMAFYIFKKQFKKS